MDTLRVHAPSSFLFLCGGKIDVEASLPCSLREAYTRVFYTGGTSKKYDLIMAEELNAFFPEGNYENILDFEADLAQLSELIVLFSESFGSVAELGAFSMVEEIANRLLVVIDDKNYSDKSFISLGPLRALENKYGATAVCVLNRADINITDLDNVSEIDLGIFSEILGRAVQFRHENSREHTSFDKNRAGHIIKLIVGFVQHYGALTFDEIEFHLNCLGFELSKATLHNYLLCAKFAKWIDNKKNGLHVYYAALNKKSAIQFDFRNGVDRIDKVRWSADIREHWRGSDPDRYSVIKSVIGG